MGTIAELSAELPSGLIELIKASEGCKLKAYQDTGGVWTIGWGHTGKEVKEGLVWTQEQANKQLLLDVARAVVMACEASPVLNTLPDSCVAAIADFVYNVGLGKPADKTGPATKYLGSTLKKRIDAGLYQAVPGELSRWTHDSKGQMLPGLVTRRAKEAALWTQGVAKINANTKNS